MKTSHFRTPLFVVCTIIAALNAVFVSGVFAAGIPIDPCTLLQPADIQVLAPDARIGNGKPSSDMAPLGSECVYSWGPRTSQWGEAGVTLVVLDTAKAYPGVDAATLKSGFDAKVYATNANKALNDQAWSLPGIGDAADFTYEARSHNGTAESYVSKKGVVVSVMFHGDSLANKDKVIALLKTAVARL